MALLKLSEQEQDDLTPAFRIFLKKALEMLREKKWQNDSISQTIEDTHLQIDTIVCPICNHEFNFKETEAKPCEHLLALMDDWQYV